MKLTVVLVIGAALAAAVPASAGGSVGAAAEEVKGAAEAVKEVWGVAKEITIDLHDAAKSQEASVTKEVEPFSFALPDDCEPVASFDSNDHDKVRFGFGVDQNVWYQLVWSGVVCGAPQKYRKSGPQEWYYLKNARLVPIQTVAMSGQDLAIHVKNGEIAPKRLPMKADKGKKAPPPLIYLQGSFELEVLSKNLFRSEAATTLIVFDAMGGCSFSGNTRVLKLLGGECFVDNGGVKRSTDKALTLPASSASAAR